MISFLKSFFSNERSSEEQALMNALNLDKQRDVLVVESANDAEEPEACAPRGCGGCGCG
jgi:hypothetical protein